MESGAFAGGDIAGAEAAGGPVIVGAPDGCAAPGSAALRASFKGLLGAFAGACLSPMGSKVGAATGEAATEDGTLLTGAIERVDERGAAAAGSDVVVDTSEAEDRCTSACVPPLFSGVGGDGDVVFFAPAGGC